jgi:drug/metabolite transporter (DMT)-like permease
MDRPGAESAADRFAPSAGLGFLLALVFIWGGNYTWMKIALQDVGPWTFNALRYLGGAALLAAVFVVSGQRDRLAPAPGERLSLAVVGLLQATLMTSFTALALVYADASRVVLIAYSMPIWAILWGYVVLGERSRPLALVGALLGIAGVGLLTLPGRAGWSVDAAIGTGIALIAVQGWALGSVLYRRKVWRTPFWSQIFWQVAVTAAVMAPLALILERWGRWENTASLWIILLYNVAAPTVLGFWCWAKALSRMPAGIASQVLVLSPIFGMLQSHLVLGEPLTETIWLAALAVSAGALLALRAGGAPR